MIRTGLVFMLCIVGLSVVFSVQSVLAAIAICVGVGLIGMVDWDSYSTSSVPRKPI